MQKIHGCLVLLLFSLPAFAEGPALDRSLQPEQGEEIANVFRDMGVIQRRAMPKGGRFLFSSFGTFDFSDGPYTNYSFHFNPGYAFSDFFEAYLNLVPFYLVSARSIVDTVHQLQLQNGQTADIVAARPQTQIGIDLVWAPAYGKDSYGLSSIIRSDTFLKFGAAQINYDSGSGLKFTGGLGKTYFLGRSTGARFCVDFGYLQTIVDGVKAFKSMALLETGIVFYL